MDQDPPLDGQVIRRRMKAAIDRRRTRQFDLECPAPPCIHFENEVGFRACGCSIEIGTRTVPCRIDQRFDHKSFPTLSDNGIPAQGIARFNRQQRVKDTAIADKRPGCLDQPFVGIGEPRFEDAHQQEFFEDLEIAGNCMTADPKRTRIPLGIEQFALVIGQHAPEQLQSLGIDLKPELRNIAFDIGANEVQPPLQARCIAVA